MRRYVLLPVAALMLVAFTQSDQAIHERVLTDILARYVQAGIYDRHCNNGAMLDDNELVLQRYADNGLLIEGRLKMALSMRGDDPAPDYGAIVQKSKERMAEEAGLKIRSGTCSSVFAGEAAQSLDMFTGTASATINQMISAEIARAGSSVSDLMDVY